MNLNVYLVGDIKRGGILKVTLNNKNFSIYLRDIH